jgi:hypothetical protein
MAQSGINTCYPDCTLGNGEVIVTESVCDEEADTSFTIVRLFFTMYLYAPFRRRGAYCFAPVGQSVDQTMSAQYLENLSLDCYDISYVGW